MKSLFIGLITSVLTLSCISMASASNTSMPIPAISITASTPYSINQDKIIDGFMFNEMSYQMMSSGMMEAESIWWADPSITVTMDLGNSFMVQEMLMQVDSSDVYQMEYSIDNSNWSNLFTVTPKDGDVSWGMDTMSSDSLDEEYIAVMDFSAVEARYLRVSASGGDSAYYISELQAFGSLSLSLESLLIEPKTTSPVPAPPSLMLFGAGLMMLMGLQYRRKKQMSGVSTS